MVAKNLTEQIKYSRKAMQAISLEIGLSEGAVGDFANGRSLPTLENFKKLCKALDCNYEDILGSVDD